MRIGENDKILIKNPEKK